MKSESFENRKTGRVTYVSLTAETFLDEQFLTALRNVQRDVEGSIFVIQKGKQIGGIKLKAWEEPGA